MGRKSRLEGGERRDQEGKEGEGAIVCFSISLGRCHKEQECIHRLRTWQFFICQTHFSARTRVPTMCMGPGAPESQCGMADGERAVLSPSEEMSGLIQENGSWDAVKREGGTQDALQCFLELSWSHALELFSPSIRSLETEHLKP